MELSQKERQIPLDVTNMWNLKCDKNKPVDETETDSGTYRIDSLLLRWRGLGEERSGRLVGGSPHSSTPAWKIPWMKEPGGLQSTGSLRVGHN